LFFDCKNNNFKNKMGDKNFGTNLGSKLKGFKIEVKEEKVPEVAESPKASEIPESTSPGLNPLGADAITKKTLEEAKENGAISFFDDEILELYKKQYVTKAVADRNIAELEEKIREKIAEAAEEAKKKGENAPSNDEIIISVLKDHRHGTNPKGHVLVEFYEKKINAEKKADDSDNDQTELPRENVDIEKLLHEIRGDRTTVESRASSGTAEAEKPVPIGVGTTAEEFNKKYPGVLKTKRFNDKGGDLYIQEYNEGKIKCFITEKGKKPSPIILSQSQFEDVLKKYTHVDETIRRIIPVNAAKKESVEHESEGQDFEKILGKESADKIIVIMREFKKDLLKDLETDETWKEYKKSTRNDILRGEVKKTLIEMLDIVIKRKNIVEKINEKEFIKYFSEKI